MMIRLRQDGGERQLTYDEFVREVRAGQITGSTMILDGVLTSGVWKPALELPLFRAWAPEGTVPPGPSAPAMPPGPVREEEEAPEEEAAGEEGAAREEGAAPEEEAARQGEGPRPGPERSAPEPPQTEMAFTPTPAVMSPPEPDERDRIPWERQDRIGFVRSLYDTIRLAFDDGLEYARRIAVGSTVMPSLVFGIVMTAITAIFNAVYGIGALSVTRDLMERMESQAPDLFGKAGPPTTRDILFLEGMRILFFPLAMFVWAGFIHLFLRFLGRPARPFSATFRVASYAMAPMILNVLPVCGVLIGGVWMLVLTVRGLTVVQRSSLSASTLAVLFPTIGFLLWTLLANEGVLRVLPHLGGSG